MPKNPHGHLRRVYESLRRPAAVISSEKEHEMFQTPVPPELAMPSEANVERTRKFFADEFKLTGQGNSKQKEAYRLGVLFFARELDAAEKRGEERALQAAGLSGS